MTFFIAVAAIVVLALSVRALLKTAGERALAKQPDVIHFVRLAGDSFRDAAGAERLAAPLRAKGFVPLGVYVLPPIDGLRISVMLNQGARMAAFLHEHPKLSEISLELNVRYVDGTTTMLVNHASRGVPQPPFIRVIYADPATDSGELFERLMRERTPFGIKSVDPRTVFTEYESAWTRIMLWQKQRGLSAAEVATIARLGSQENKPAP